MDRADRTSRDRGQAATWLRRSIPIVAALLTGGLPTSGLAGQASPAPRPLVLPEPWGEYTPGVATVALADSSRFDTISGSPRPILARLWYPSDVARPAPESARRYMDPATAEAWRSTLPVVAGFEGAVRTHAVEDALPSDAADRWPVLLFSHGRSFPVENYQLILEHMASMGWVVAAISHPHEEAMTVFPDGRRIPFNGPTWDDEADRGSVLQGVVDEMVEDAGLVLDRLATLPTGHYLSGRLALDSVGYFGHSLGGAAAAWALQRDPRVVAAATWEGQVYRDRDRPLETVGPLLYVIGGANRRELSGTQYRAGQGGPVYELLIRGAWHASFGDMLWVYRRYADRGWLERHRREVRALRVNELSADYLHEFFQHYLLGGPLDLLWPDSPEDAGSPARWDYPEAELRVYAP